MNRVGIIGGGAAGMTAAIAAARGGAQVTVFEHTARLGKKILSTGNGRCNLANEYLAKRCYHGAHPEFAMKVIDGFGLKETLDFFESIGIHPVKNSEGYYYPGSMQAAAVSGALTRELKHLGVRVIDEIKINRVRLSRAGECQNKADQFKVDQFKAGQFKSSGADLQTNIFVIESDKGDFTVDKLILACGGCAFPKSGSDGSGYDLAKRLGLKQIPAVPALVPLTSSWKGLKELSGIRTGGRITLYIGGKKIASESGELQFADYGLSGIAVFQLSGFVSRALAENKKTDIEVSLNLTEEFSESGLKDYLVSQIRRNPSTRCGDFLTGLLPEKLGLMLFRRIGVSLDQEVGRLKDTDLDKLVRECRAFRLPINGTLGFDRAQVAGGGVDTAQIDPATMEAKNIPGLYAVGELLDVDGICGGYNLQFAWSSGYLAGKSAAGKVI